MDDLDTAPGRVTRRALLRVAGGIGVSAIATDGTVASAQDVRPSYPTVHTESWAVQRPDFETAHEELWDVERPSFPTVLAETWDVRRPDFPTVHQESWERSGEVAPIDGTLPTDPDDDGLYEDVNGNDRQDIADAVDLFQHRESVDPQFFDFNDSGEMEVGDAVELFRENAG